MEHKKQAEVNKLLEANFQVMLVGSAGTGKTTMLQKAAKEAKVKYSFIAGTRQTTVSNILGFMSVNGTYVRSVFREAYEHGHYFNIDEIDAMDVNATLVFNSLEGGIMPFPDGYSEPPHKDFRLCATANPLNEHSDYTGRSKMDAATLDRFDKVEIPHDSNLEATLVSPTTFREIRSLREVIVAQNVHIQVSMRDALRYEKRKAIGLADNYIKSSLLKEYPDIFRLYEEQGVEAVVTVPEAVSWSSTQTGAPRSGTWTPYEEEPPGHDYIPTQDTANTLGEIWTIISKGETK